MDYLELELKVGSGAGGEYPVHVLASPTGEVHGTARLAVGAPELQNRLTDLDTSRSSDATRGSAPLAEGGQVSGDAARRIGQMLFEALLRDDVYSSYFAGLQLAKKEGKGLRLRLRIEAPDLAALPWEYLYDPKHKRDHLSLLADTPIVRHLDVQLLAERLALEPPMRMLGMVGHGEGLDVAAEQRRMNGAVERLKQKGAVTLEWIEGRSWRDLQRALRKGPWHVFHFIGHGGFDQEKGEGLVFLEDEPGGSHADGVYPLPASELGTYLAGHPSLKLVVLNSCEGAKASAGSLFSSTGAILAARGIPAVISMQYEISDLVAQEFAFTLYEVLAEQQPVDVAVAEARRAVRGKYKGVEWGTPVLHMRSKDGLLFYLDQESVVGLAPAADGSAADSPPALARPIAASAPTREGKRARGRSVLLRQVRERWVEGALEDALRDSVLMEPGMRMLAGAVDNPWGVEEEDEDLAPDQSLDTLFQDLGGCVLFLGEPGSGKTINLLRLAKSLVAKTEADPKRPVPVVLNLSSWQGTAQPIAEWIAVQLSELHRVPMRVGRAWVADGALLPLLDGLDEVPPDLRKQCVEAINAFTEHTSTGTVVCCRYAEYQELKPTKLRLNGAVLLNELSREQVLSYVTQVGAELEGLKAALERDFAMLVDARSPLMLSLMMQTYKGVDAEAVVNEGSADARRTQLMNDFMAWSYRRAGGAEVAHA